MGEIELQVAQLNELLVGVSEHRSRLAVTLADVEKRVSALTKELEQVRSQSRLATEESENATRQLRRTNEKLTELARQKQLLEAEEIRLSETVSTLQNELSTARGQLESQRSELAKLQAQQSAVSEERDALKTVIQEHDRVAEVEREQWETTVVGLRMEVESVHEAARVLGRQRYPVVSQRHSGAPDGDSDKREQSVELRLAHATSSMEELERLREERTGLFARVRELERDAGALLENNRLAQELRNTQLQKTQIERRLAESVEEIKERDALRCQVAELMERVREGELLRVDVQRLRARLYKAPVAASSGIYPAGSGVFSDTPEPRGSVEQELLGLAKEADARSAVVADGLGFAVAAAGEPGTVERLAAMAGVVGRVGEQARSLLDFSEVVEVTVRDRDGRILHYRFFAMGDDVMALGILGDSVPDQIPMDRVVSATLRSLHEPRDDQGVPPKVVGQ
jgi:predicted regulator of Ras-like GTPase activity (Roadblock/LC7/MglB family)